MRRTLVNSLTLWLLIIVMSVSLILNLPSPSVFADYYGQTIAYAALTAFTLYIGVLLSEGELSAAHVIGMVAFLSLPQTAQPLLTWAIFFGGVAGGLLLVLLGSARLPRRPLTVRSARSVIVMSARVTLSFVAAAQFYLGVGGTVPLSGPLRAELTPLLTFSLFYVLVYFGIFLLETYIDGRSVQRMFRENLAELFAILILPVPFSILSALLITYTPSAFYLFIGGVILVTLGLYGLSRAQYRLRQQVNELRSLAVVSQALQAKVELPSLLTTIYNQVAQLLKVDDFLVALAEAEHKRLHFPLAIRGGKTIHLRDTEQTNTLLGYMLQTQTSLLIAQDVAAWARQKGLQPPATQVQSWLGVPLLAAGKLMGGLVVTSDDPQQRFGLHDLRLLNIVAASASIAIDNAQLYEHQTARINRLSILNRVLPVLTNTLLPDHVLDAIISSGSVIVEATAVAVYLFWDDAQSTLALVRCAGLSERFAGDPPDPLLIQPQQAPVIISDVSRDERATPYRDLMTHEQKAAWVEMPLTTGNSSLGAIIFYFDTPQSFDEEMVEIIRAFASQAAQAIKNARLYTTTDKALERRIEQMAALAALGRQLTAAMSPRAICNLVLSRALELSRAAAGLIVLKDTTTSQPVIMAQSGYPPTIPVGQAVIESSATGCVLQSGQIVRLQDAGTDSDCAPILPTSRSVLSVPIQRSGETLGAITLESSLTDTFSEDYTQFVGQLANQTIIAVDNTRLFERTQEALDRLQVILDAMTEAIILIDRTGKVALANPGVNLIGLEAELIVNQEIATLLDRSELKFAERLGFASAQAVRDLLGKLRVSGAWIDSDPVSYNLKNDGSTAYIQRYILPVGSDGAEPLGLLLVFYDETEEREVAQMREDLSRMIVHDIRSPLTAVTTSLKLIRDLVPPESSFRPLVDSTTETSQRAIRKILSRVDSLLDISKMESGQLNLDTEPAELATLVDSVCMELSPVAHELEVVVTSEVSESTPLLNIDPDKIERVLQNLLDNALKFSPAETEVTVRAYAPGTQGAPEHFVRVEVIDRGPGVPHEYKDKLFERFVQIKGRRSPRRGIGLGLTFCRLAVEAHGGRIWIEDNPAGGSIFAFTLPLAQVEDLDDTGEFPAISRTTGG